MSTSTVAADLQKRHRSERYAGIYYRVKADRSRTYSVSFGGKFVRAGTTEKEALAKQAELRRAKARGQRVVVNDRTTFAEIAESWLELKSPKLRPRTLAYYRDALNLVLLPCFGQWRISAIDADAISALIRGLEREGLHAVDPTRSVRGLGRSSIDNYCKPLQGILKLAVRRRLIAESPWLHLTDDDRPAAAEKTPPHEWSDEELDALLAASTTLARKQESRYDYTPLLRLTARLGLRLGEVLGLQWQDFDREASVLHVRRQWLRTGEHGPTKTKAGVRSIALPADLARGLLELRVASRHSADDDPIFASRAGTALTHRNVTARGFEPAAKLAGLERVSFHDLRHACASRLIGAGVDPVTVAAVLGHEDPSITLKVYAHLFNRQKRDEQVRSALAGGAR